MYVCPECKKVGTACVCFYSASKKKTKTFEFWVNVYEKHTKGIMFEYESEANSTNNKRGRLGETEHIVIERRVE